MPELIKKVGTGHIFFCQGCNDYHYLPDTFIQLGTTEEPTFDSCSQIRDENKNESFDDHQKYECRFRIAAGIIRYWASNKHMFHGFYKMIPLDQINPNMEIKFASNYEIIKWRIEAEKDALHQNIVFIFLISC